MCVMFYETRDFQRTAGERFGFLGGDARNE